ncbi:bifunctional 2-C-methyl-D-erythritol 4-phosphate cytidylyltransferase/2-C-methyl-D-erythritol 2,4-cyclodiphosphate synthase [Novispirillum itersonii]|uniref:Bifunctional enzyme IspD/IspF n=1 Tax=Novispirillum itersonii TaxID=189 RepID=A0A7X0DLF5_NOVIT|nr:bifunctional 2-C-methyl-D-erythritol 4-phosphate cytidylyltransferase/2-C-methyl-D-erythritol 2,4-cyclodiphosphate synthase [Novispirillum itersonii]MBB6209973.1 2-C-methyl-D-erythritol 4-phosphate cytidylyltransferase/2-C-methyl-D-erythritol 2,4-cyclodiphosphate synthase [Novispirillum itersonii]
MKVAVVVVAAGRGSRFGSTIPKQYLPLNGQPLLRHSLAAFCAHPAVRGVVTVIHPDDQALYEVAAAGLTVLPPVHGGAERQDSVRKGLEALDGKNFDAVLIHDAARPFISRRVIDSLLTALKETAGAIPGLPVVDTVKKVDGDRRIVATQPREGLWRAQTPQAFRFAEILAAHRHFADRALTDDAAVLEAAGGTVVMVEGDPGTLKVTTRDDLSGLDHQAPTLLEPRTGSGFDVHAFCEGTFVTLCGLEVPHTHGLAGHSDADVGIHALADALYGAIGAGDIGKHFPPTDMRWKGAPSDIFLRHAATLITACGGRISNVDLTLICEMPKIGPHRLAMVQRLADTMGISAAQVSVKATTTEQLGFTGRGEGIACQAVATVMMPVSE